MNKPTIWDKDVIEKLSDSDYRITFPDPATIMGLEKDFPVEVPFKYFKAFDKQDICFPERSYNAYKSPRLIIEEKNSTEKASIPYPGMKKSENKYFIFYFAEDAFNEKIIEVLED